jgi:hypothetical protein
MRVIGTKTHGYLDYIVGILLIAAPWLFGFYAGGAETWVPVILGASTIMYSLLTDYELGIARTISMRTHLVLDMLSGLLLLISPWLFGFADHIWEPHVIVGIIEIGAAMMTQKVPHTERQRQVHHQNPITH